MRTRILCFLLVLLLLAGCAGAPEETELPKEETKAPMEARLESLRALGSAPDDGICTWYEIFVGAFRDSDGDGTGDLQGVISSLDYLQDLGIGGLWLMPVHPSDSYHKYDVKDYCAVDPAYGTMEDLEQLLEETDRRGMKVILDLVMNHTSVRHPWFREAAAYLASLDPEKEPDSRLCPPVEYYRFQRQEAPGFGPVPGAEGWYYECRFSPDMPDVNFESQALREKFREIMAFWLDRGVDGFRLDAAKEFYSGETDRNLEVLGWIQTTAREINPDCFLVGEVWDGFSALSEYYDSGFVSFFNFPFAASDGKIVKVLRGAGNPGVVSTWATAQQKADAAYRSHNPDYIDAPFLSNHDLGRIAGFAGRDPGKTKLAAAMNLFMGGNAFVYYGEELGMVAGALDDPSYRAPMVWGGEGTPNPPPGCTLPESYPFGTLETQREDPLSVYNYYRQAIAIRNAVPAIARGIPTAEAALNQGCISAVRKTWGEECCLVLMNISGEAQTVDLAGCEGWELLAGLSVSGEDVAEKEGTLYLPAYGAAVLTENHRNKG